ncbi:MAG: hypothetical protein J0M24_19625 [Verrucomicrobia bacterium]|nr:hypothetical protein [Verrucomicrobiota bacterium]
MGIRAKALTDHRVPDFRNQAAVLALLTPTLPATRVVADYWRAVQPHDTDTVDAWSAYFIQSPTEGDYLRYDGPAKFSVSFGERVARVSGPCRWSGFCTMAAIQSPHAVAFRAISRALGGQRMVLIPDYDPVEEIALYEGRCLDDCIALLEQGWGVPQPTTTIVTDDDEVYYQRQYPAWFVEKL